MNGQSPCLFATSKWLFSSLFLIILSGCSITLDERPLSSESLVEGRTDLKVAVYDIVNMTNGDNGQSFKATNLQKVISDDIYQNLINSGQFKSVERINESFNKNELRSHDYDIIVTGEIALFKSNDTPVGITFINPFALLSVITPIPTSTCERTGQAEMRVLFINAKTFKAIDEISVKTKFEPQNHACSPWLATVHWKYSFSLLRDGLIQEFNGKFSTNLKSEFGEMLVKLDPASAKNFPMSKLGASPGADDREEMEIFQTDLDTLPKAKTKKKHGAYAIVIGIEKYRQKLPRADFATNDARLVAEYLQKVMGYPEENIVVMTNENASKSDFEKYFEKWLPNNVESGSSVFVYYSGHGSPNPASGDAYLVPYDSDPNYIDQTGYSLKRMYASLGKLRAKEVIVALDACFSGVGGKSVIAQGTRSLSLKLKTVDKRELPTNIVILSASTDTQVSSTYKEKGHGLFTYYMLKGMKTTLDDDPEASLEVRDLYGYLKPQVERVARKINNTEQSPQLILPTQSLESIRIY